VPGLEDEYASFVHAVRNPVAARPLKQMLPASGRVAIVIADGTRPSPSHKLVPWILEECGLGRERVVIVNGTGTHRANTAEELRDMLGSQIADNYHVVNHDAFADESLRYVGTTAAGCRVMVNRDYLDAEFKIVTGFIEPHFFAGFSGGPKGVIPGVVGIETVLHLHSAPMISHPKATWGVLAENPVQEMICEAALMTQPHFVVNVTLNREKQITGVYAGDIIEAHRLGCAFAHKTAMQPVTNAYDVVVTTNAGYPLDQNLYQAVKGMSAAASIVREDGAIIVASECSDGVPEHGNFKSMLEAYDSVERMMKNIESSTETVHDQWQVQVLGLILRKARVYLVSSLEPEQVTQAFMIPCESVEQALHMERARQEVRTVACLPEGPYTIPYLG
jgi:nickel-dependent lactate racemase